MYKYVIRNDFDKNVVDMTFMITNKCNYTCTYCIENLQKLSYSKYVFLDLSKTYKFIVNYINMFQFKKINIRIYGGEPTLHPDLVDFCEKLNTIDNILIIEIFTNFSSSITLYNQLLSIKKLHLFCSYHTSKIMPAEHYIKKLFIFSKQYNTKIVCNVMLENDTQENTKFTYDLYKKILKFQSKHINKIRTELIPIFSTPLYKSTYSKYMFKILETVNSLNNEKLCFTAIDNFNNKTEFKKVVGYDSLNFKNWICSSGENAFFVDPFGDIYPCGGLYTKRKIIYNHTKMKNIFTDDIESLFNYTICPHNDCVLCVPMEVKNINNIDTLTIKNIEKFNVQ